MGSTFTIPTPEQMQYMMGIHPIQVAASQAIAQSAMGPNTGEQAPPEGGTAPEGSSGEPEGKTEKSEGNSKATPTVATPDSMNVRGVGGTIQPPDANALAALSNPSSPRPISAAQQRAQQDQERTARDQATLDQMRAKPAGVVNFQ